MKNTILLILVFLLYFNQSHSQKLLDFNEKISSYDISSLYVESTSPEKYSDITIDKVEPIGFFGENFQRFYVHMISIVQNNNDPLEYYVYGKSKLKQKISSFSGKMKITKCQILDEEDVANCRRGFVTLKYEFFEDKLNGGTGKFIGTCQSSFFIDDENKIFYDAIYLYADSFDNNQFEGNWVSYSSDKSYKCNWGDFRIPGSEELDTGTGEFKVLKKYLNNGWKSYQYAKGYGYESEVSREEIEAAESLEKEEWWK